MKDYKDFPHTGTDERNIACVHRDEEGNHDPIHGQRFKGEGLLNAFLTHRIHEGHSQWMGVTFEAGDDDSEDCFLFDKEVAMIYQTFAYIGEDCDLREVREFENAARERRERATILRRTREAKDNLMMERFGWKDNRKS